MAKQYQTIGLGGTFDHLHDGHKQFLDFAANLSLRLHIGITNPKLTLHKSNAHLIQSWDKRAQAVKKYCQIAGVQCTIDELHDVYGPTINDDRIQAIVVTQETIGGAYKINEARSKLGLTELPIHTAPLLNNDAGQPLHSEQIREGLVNRHGVVYDQLFKSDRLLSEDQRLFFQKPAGELVHEPMRVTESLTCVVGDYSLENFIKRGWEWNVGIFDQKQQRTEFISPELQKLTPQFKAINPAGLISRDMVTQLQLMIAQTTGEQHTLLIDGEEDLATVALILLLPLDSLIYYGQPNKGMVEVVVTEQLKDKVFRILL